jgi:histidinol-phosphate/aromatic aminotransferase/cobyric acid decarboxylase-like protein
MTNSDVPVSTLFSVGMAGALDLPLIYRLRHHVYAEELRQHAGNESGLIQDAIDAYNLYLTVKKGRRLVGFISITPQGSPRFSIEKYLDRRVYPEFAWQSLYELRLLTVCPSERSGFVASILLYSAGRWLQAHGAEFCIGMGRREIMKLYQRIGFCDHGLRIQSGDVEFELMTIDRKGVDESIRGAERWRRRISKQIDWRFDFPFDPATETAACYHGGQSIRAMGCDIEKVDEQTQVINADVLDAWFPPSPRAVRVIEEHLSWMMRTSPPTNAEEIRQKIALARGVPEKAVVTGAGSSDLIFRAFQHWLDPGSRVLLIKPCYAEYEYVCRNVIRCRVDSVELEASSGFQLDPDALVARLRETVYDLVVIVNPNNPTGAFLLLEFWRVLLHKLQSSPGLSPPRIWIDECYVDYVDASQSMESLAALDPSVVVCKSLSKSMALSGLRAGYLTLVPELAEDLRRITPPWNLGTLTQLGLSAALEEPEYYRDQFDATHRQRAWLEFQLSALGFTVIPGTANFFLAYLPAWVRDKSAFLQHCEQKRLFLRDTFPTSPELGHRTIRFAVKDPISNQHMLEIIQRGLAHGA